MQKYAPYAAANDAYSNSVNTPQTFNIQVH